MMEFFNKLWTKAQIAVLKFFGLYNSEEIPDEKPTTFKMRLRQMPRAEILEYDTNGDGKVDIGDVSTLVENILSDEPDPNMDLNSDGTVDISDVVELVNIIQGASKERDFSNELLGYDYVSQPADTIYYKTYNNKPYYLFVEKGFGFNVELVSNVYEDGYGKLIFSGAVTTIPNHAFYFGTELVSLSIPKKVVTIGAHAFANCKRLETIVLGESVERINLVVNTSEGGSFAFDDCVKLNNIISLAKNNPAIDWSTFRDMGKPGDRKLYIGQNSTGYQDSWLKVGTGSGVYLGNYGFKLEWL